jgi:chaperonin GroES
MIEKLQPLGDHLVVKRVEIQEKSKGGIIVPDSAKEKPQEGEVISVGPGKLTKEGIRIPPEVKVGDRVIFAKFGGTEIKVNDEKLLILQEGDILAIKSW